MIFFIKRVLLFLSSRGCIKISDKKYLEMLYENHFKRKLNLENPRTFNEKIQWLKLYDRNDNYTKLVDKYEVKKYVSKAIGDEYIIPTIGVWDNFEDIDFETLPNKFVLKCTHDSGSTIICKDKSKFDINKAKRKLNKCLKRNFYLMLREYPYKNVKPKIICEKYMEDKKVKEIYDYKFMCSNGKVKFSYVSSNRFLESGMCMDFYDINWNRLPFYREYKNSTNGVAKPKTYNKMIELAEKLSSTIPFVRVDFYEINGKIYFGEFTFYPGSGIEKFTPDKYDKIMGDMIDLSKVNNK